MHFFVIEIMTASKTGISPDDPEHSIYVEGRTMRDAITVDLRNAGHSVEFGSEPNATWPDAAIVIAPEFDGLLEASCKPFRENETRIIGCDDFSRQLTSDKYRLAQHWTKHGISTPVTMMMDWPRDRFPAVMKQRFGAGSNEMYLVVDESGWKDIYKREPWRLIIQDFISGRAASVSFLMGHSKTILLRATWQDISNDGRFHYLGGKIALSPSLELRAFELARRAVDVVPGLCGYVGVDLILGNAADGSEDYAIEINPRLTTSYVGLRVLADFNLAQAMIDVVEGRPVDYIRWKPGRVQFWPDGRVEYDPTPGAVWE